MLQYVCILCFSHLLCMVFPSHINTTDKAAPEPSASLWTVKHPMLPVHLHIIWANLQFMLGQYGNDTIVLIDTYHERELLHTANNL